MSISRRSIASTLAARFLPENITAPSGETTVQTSTWLLPDRINQTPAFFIFPPEEEFSYPPSMRTSAMDWRARLFLYKLADTARQTDLLYRWSDALYDQLDDSVHLSIPSTVLTADVMGMKAGTLTYADESFDGVELVIHVAAQEAVTFSG